MYAAGSWKCLGNKLRERQPLDIADISKMGSEPVSLAYCLDVWDSRRPDNLTGNLYSGGGYRVPQALDFDRSTSFGQILLL